MRFRNINNWNNIENKRGLLFFIQRLDELTFPYTLDSYKSPTMSLQGLIYEAISLLREATNLDKETADKSVNSANNIIEEIKIRMKGNWIAKHVCSISAERFLLANHEQMKIDEITRHLDIIVAEIDVEAYLGEIVENVITLADNPKQKAKLDFLAREFSSFLQDRGVSRDHINLSLVEFFYNEIPINTPQQLKIFSQIVYPHQHNFRVFVGAADILLSFDQEILTNNKMIILNEETAETEELALEQIDNLQKELESDTIIIIFVMATDYNSALSVALSRLDYVCNFYRLFNHKDEIPISPFALVEQGCCEGIRKRIEAPRNNMHYIRDMRKVKATSTLKRFNDGITLDVGKDRTKFQNVINIHRMSLESKSEDIQVVNLWTCLETIAPSTRSGSKISNVVNRVVPVLMLGYFNRLVVNLLFDIIRWDRRSLTKSLKLASVTNHHDLKDKFIALLTEKENENALSDLYTRCKEFELLRFRIHSMSNLIKDTKNAQDKLTSHENMIRWQLHRIYRTRNRIVHAGESPKFTRYLVENAHDFFDQTLLFCLELSAWKRGFSTFLMCFDYAENQYNEYKNRIKLGEQNSIVWTLPKTKDRSYIFSEI